MRITNKSKNTHKHINKTFDNETEARRAVYEYELKNGGNAYIFVNYRINRYYVVSDLLLTFILRKQLTEITTQNGD